MKGSVKAGNLEEAVQDYYHEPEKKHAHSEGVFSILDALKVQFPIKEEPNKK